MVKLDGGGSVINGATQSSYINDPFSSWSIDGRECLDLNTARDQISYILLYALNVGGSVRKTLYWFPLIGTNMPSRYGNTK